MTDLNAPVARPGESLVHLHFIDPDTQGRSTWIGTCVHRALLRDADGRLNLEVMIDVSPGPEDAAEDESFAEPEPPAAAAFRVGDLVEITGRDGAEVTASSGAALNGKTGVVTEIDDNPEYPIGVAVEGFVGLVWCSSAELRHSDAAAVGSGARS